MQDVEAELERLITHPRETETVEYKGWLDLKSKGKNNDPALLAKALIAIRNSDGGHVVLGFRDDRGQPLRQLDTPKGLPSFNGDDVQRIVKRYADPEFQCDLRIVQGHPVITVPAGVSEPVIASAGSPDEKTLVVGKYYIRCPGPASREPRNGLEWKNLIDRCVGNNRDAIVSKIIPVLNQLERMRVIELSGASNASDRIKELLDD